MWIAIEPATADRWPDVRLLFDGDGPPGCTEARAPAAPAS